MGLFSKLPVRAELPAAGGDRRQRNADGAFWSPTRGTYQGLQVNPSYLPQGVSLYSQYDDLGGANPWDLIDISSELGTGNLQAASIPKWLRDLGGRAGPAITPGNVAFETFNPQLGRQDYFYTTEGLGARDGDANNPGGLVDPDNFKRLAWDPRIVEASRTGDWSILNGMPYDVLDRSGKVIGQKVIEGMGKEDGVDQMVGMAAAALATAGAAGWLGGGAGAAGTAGGVNAATGVPLSVIPEGAAFVPASGAEVAGMVGGTAGFGVPSGTAAMGAGSFGAGINPATGVGFDVIPQGAAFTPASGSEVAGMVNGTAGFGVPAASGAINPMTGVGYDVIPEGAAFTPATSAEMAAMGVPTGGGLFSTIGNAATNLLGGGGGAAGAGGFNWTSLLGPAATLIGGGMASNAAKDAAEAQIQAQREAQALQEPWRQAGMKGLNRLQELLGIGGDPNAADYGSAAKDFAEAEPVVAPFTQQAPQWRDFTLDDFQKDPGYEFRKTEGTNALSRAYAGKGNFLSGAALKGITRFGQDYASGEYGKAFDRYQTGYSNRVGDFDRAYSRYNTDRANTMGEYQNRFARYQTTRANKLSPFQSLAGVGQSTAQNMGGNITAAGDAAAAGRIGSNNAISDALSGAFKVYQNSQNSDENNAMMRALLRSRGVAV
jgi:hypothetical protein